MFSSVNSN